MCYCKTQGQMEVLLNEDVKDQTVPYASPQVTSPCIKVSLSAEVKSFTLRKLRCAELAFLITPYCQFFTALSIFPSIVFSRDPLPHFVFRMLYLIMLLMMKLKKVEEQEAEICCD